MAKIHCKVKGITPYVFNRQVEGPTPKTLEQNIQRALDLTYCHGESINSFKVPEYKGTYNVNDGSLFMPGNQFKGSMRAALSLFKVKIDGSMKRGIDLLNASVYIEPHWPDFQPEMAMGKVVIEKHWITTDPMKGKGQHKYFSIIEPGWELEFEIEHAGLFDIAHLEDALIKGGLYCGVGGRRIHKCGRFDVVEFG